MKNTFSILGMLLIALVLTSVSLAQEGRGVTTKQRGEKTEVVKVKSNADVVTQKKSPSVSSVQAGTILLGTSFEDLAEFNNTGAGTTSDPLRMISPTPSDWRAFRGPTAGPSGERGPWAASTGVVDENGVSVWSPVYGERMIAADFNSTIDVAGGSPIDDYLITPTITGYSSSATDSLVFFLQAAGGQYKDSLQIVVSPTAGTTAADFTTLVALVEAPGGGWVRFAYQLNLPSGTASYRVGFRYKLTSGGFSGASSNILGIDSMAVVRHTTSDVNEIPNVTPKGFALNQNYPNPFNPATTIQYSIVSAQQVSLKVYDLLGREVAALVNERQAAGVYEAKFDASKLSSGMYLYRLQAGSNVETRKMMLTK